MMSDQETTESEHPRDDDGAEETDALAGAVETISTEIARAMEDGEEGRIALYARVEELGGQIANLLPAAPERPDEQLVLFLRRLLELLAGRFPGEAINVARYLLTDAPGSILIAATKAAIEDVRGTEVAEAQHFYESVIGIARDASRRTEAGTVVEAMFREAKDGLR